MFKNYQLCSICKSVLDFVNICILQDVRKKLAYDIARGMEYLHCNQIVHGDLAARNCIVYRPTEGDDASAWDVKVGDNGYYNINFQGCYYNKVRSIAGNQHEFSRCCVLAMNWQIEMGRSRFSSVYSIVLANGFL